MQFVVCIQYLCKHSFSIPFKEYAITLHIIHLMPHIICHCKTLIKIILDAAYTALLHLQFMAHIQYLCKCGFWVPFKECLIMLDILDIMTHIVCHQKPMINTYPCTMYTGLVYLWFVACIQYLCKRSFSIPLKEYAITFHIIYIMPHIICCWKALIKIILNATYTALVHPRFQPRLQYFCIRSFMLL